MVPEDGQEAENGGSGYAEEFSAPAEAVAPAEQNGEGGAAAAAEGERLQDRRARCLEWCLDHGFEYVEADCRNLERGAAFRVVWLLDQENGKTRGGECAFVCV